MLKTINTKGFLGLKTSKQTLTSTQRGQEKIIEVIQIESSEGENHSMHSSENSVSIEEDASSNIDSKDDQDPSQLLENCQSRKYNIVMKCTQSIHEKQGKYYDPNTAPLFTGQNSQLQNLQQIKFQCQPSRISTEISASQTKREQRILFKLEINDNRSQEIKKKQVKRFIKIPSKPDDPFIILKYRKPKTYQKKQGLSRYKQKKLIKLRQMKLIAQDYDPYAQKSRLYLKVSKLQKTIKLKRKYKNRQKSDWIPSYLMPTTKPKLDTLTNQTLAIIPPLMTFDLNLKASHESYISKMRLDLLSRQYHPDSSNHSFNE